MKNTNFWSCTLSILTNSLDQEYLWKYVLSISFNNSHLIKILYILIAPWNLWKKDHSTWCRCPGDRCSGGGSVIWTAAVAVGRLAAASPLVNRLDLSRTAIFLPAPPPVTIRIRRRSDSRIVGVAGDDSFVSVAAAADAGFLRMWSGFTLTVGRSAAEGAAALFSLLELLMRALGQREWKLAHRYW
jgi:hypothetical protein